MTCDVAVVIGGCGGWAGCGVCLLILHSLSELREDLGDAKVTLHQMHSTVWGERTSTDRHYSIQHTLLACVVCACVCVFKAGLYEKVAIEHCWRSVYLFEAGADVTCRVTLSDTTAVWQTGQRGGGGIHATPCVCVCVCVCEKNYDEVGQLERAVKDSMGSFK